MATYTAITDAEIDQDSPITQTLMTKYRDNLTASIEGDDTAPRILSPALGLSFKSGSATRTNTGTSTMVTLDTTDLANLADMRLALLTGVIQASTYDPSHSLSGTIISNQVSSPAALGNFNVIGNTTTYTSFSYIVELSGATSINLRMTVSGVTGATPSATAYGQILILGR